MHDCQDSCTYTGSRPHIQEHPEATQTCTPFFSLEKCYVQCTLHPQCLFQYQRRSKHHLVGGGGGECTHGPYHPIVVNYFYVHTQLQTPNSEITKSKERGCNTTYALCWLQPQLKWMTSRLNGRPGAP